MEIEAESIKARMSPTYGIYNCVVWFTKVSLVPNIIE